MPKKKGNIIWPLVLPALQSIFISFLYTAKNIYYCPSIPVTFSIAVSWSVAEPPLLVCSNSSFPHFEVSGFDSSATNSKNKIKRKLIFNSINAKCLKHDKNPGILPNSQNSGTE